MSVQSLVEELILEKSSITNPTKEKYITNNLKKLSKSDSVKLKDFSTRLDNAKTKKERLDIAAEIENEIKELEDVKADKDTSLVLRSLTVVGGVMIFIPAALGMGGASSLLMGLAANISGLSNYLISSKELEKKRMDKVLDLTIEKHKKLLSRAKNE